MPSMKKTVVVYFLLLVLPAIVMPFAAHRILERELAWGRDLGLSYLQAQAELALVDPVRVNPAVEIQQAPPRDGRCFRAATADGNAKVYAWWTGNVPRGELRKRRIHRAECTVYAVSLFLFFAGLLLLVRSFFRARAEAERQKQVLHDFTHRLKTPLTSISLCAELARSGRLTQERMAESTDTVISEAEKLNGIVDEVLDFLKESGNG